MKRVKKKDELKKNVKFSFFKLNLTFFLTHFLRKYVNLS